MRSLIRFYIGIALLRGLVAQRCHEQEYAAHICDEVVTPSVMRSRVLLYIDISLFMGQLLTVDMVRSRQHTCASGEQWGNDGRKPTKTHPNLLLHGAARNGRLYKCLCVHMCVVYWWCADGWDMFSM